MNTRLILQVLLGVLITMGGVFSMAGTLSAASCENVYTYNQHGPLRNGAPYSLFTLTHELLLRGICTDTSVIVAAGNGKDSTYVYKYGYYEDRGSWKRFSFSGTDPTGEWFRGTAATTIQKEGGETRILAYMCQRVLGEWKCGCKDKDCDRAYWQEQVVQHTVTRSGRDNADRWITAYYVGYAYEDFKPDDVRYDLITHVVAGVVEPKADGSVDPHFDRKEEGDGRDIAREVRRRAHREDVEALLWLGGPSQSSVWHEATGPRTRKEFARNIVALVDELGYDGVDIDWEPIRKEDEEQVLALLAELRRLEPDMTIMLPALWILANGTYDTTNNFYAEVSELVDQLNLMTYDMSGPWPGWKSWHTSALRGESKTAYPSSVESTLEVYLEMGVPREKLGLGFGFFGKCWKEPVRIPRADLSSYTKGMSSLNYRTIMTEYYDDDRAFWDAKAVAPYLSFPRPTGERDCTYITYEDERSLREKAEYLIDEDLGGAIVWHMGQGYLPDEPRRDEQPLLTILHSLLQP